jgi:hypothetical protein
MTWYPLAGELRFIPESYERYWGEAACKEVLNRLSDLKFLLVWNDLAGIEQNFDQAVGDCSNGRRFVWRVTFMPLANACADPFRPKAA